MKKRNIYAATALLLAGTGFFSFTRTDRYAEIARNMDIFATLYHEVNQNYVDDVNPSIIMKSGIDAMLAELDPYTNYIPEDRIEEYRILTTGEYGGVGMSVNIVQGKVFVSMPMEGYPAAKAGVMVGDEITKIDGIDLTDKTGDEIHELLRGQRGSSFTITVKRFGSEKPLELTLNRELIQLANVPYYGMVTEDIGLIQLTDFTRNASKEVRTALVELKDQGAKKVVLDLRGNPGGLLNEAINISNIFLPKSSEIVSTKGKLKDWNRSYPALNSPDDVNIPLAVLVDNSSASAAEIVSGVIQDYDRGVVVGQRSYGKGLVQQTRPLSYNSKLKVTVAKYYIPSGRCIQEIDYSHRNANGDAERVPDSLKVAFKTRNGRLVYDGGGVMPDVVLKVKETPDILQALKRENLLFEFASEYRFKHASISEAKSFDVDDALFNEFKNWLAAKEYSYETALEAHLENLVTAAADEPHFDAISTDFDALIATLKAAKADDLQRFKAPIKEALEEEIVKRYYLQRGEVESGFDDDQELLAAIDILNDSAEYKQILGFK
jgi:carboxyl-terminal processing protease